MEREKWMTEGGGMTCEVTEINRLGRNGSFEPGITISTEYCHGQLASHSATVSKICKTFRAYLVTGDRML
jgi:hypothetical protein